ncbi:MAG: DNA cytosine methyltransferase [Thermoleophilaceae bacterium]
MNDRSTPIVGSLFSGIGLLDYGLSLAGWEHSFFCESEAERREILSLRWPGVPIFGDVREVDGAAPRVDLLAGGFPCRGASTAGRRTGLDHPETALWREMARVVGLLRPPLVCVENVANLLAVPTEEPGRAWGEVLGDLASLGYVCAWDCLPAAAFGAPHLRDRLFCVAADAGGEARRGHGSGGERAGRRDHAHPADGGAAADAQRNAERPQPLAERGGGGSTVAAGGGRAASDPDGAGEVGNGGQRGEQDRRADAGRGDSSAANARQGRRPRSEAGDRAEPSRSQPDAERLGVPVEWGRFGGAIERWAALHGQPPEPLCAFRGVDARRAAGLERSRLSALGDGVLVQAGHFLGERLMELALEGERDG